MGSASRIAEKNIRSVGYESDPGALAHWTVVTEVNERRKEVETPSTDLLPNLGVVHVSLQHT